MNKDTSISRQVATEVVAIFSEKLNKQITPKIFIGLSNKFSDWIMKAKNKDDLICRQAALRRAALSTNIIIGDDKITNSDELLKFADLLVKYYSL